MSNIEKTAENEENEAKAEVVSPQVPKQNVRAMFQELEIMAMQKGGKSTLDLSKLDKEQVDKVLNTMAENEKNAFTFNSARLDAIKEIELKKIDASVINQKTFRYVLLGVLIVMPIITILILFFKETFFIPWLTFLTGIAGGFGLSKATKSVLKPQDTKNPIKDDDE
ncbi:hypothetical protein VB264_16805 [Arcicella aquatica]|uniref:DUF1707 domain-containing protein n=1 Tax=Arcicella aquatica TaxID=217141 RepID=A0ABU5QQV1_9BACT|nr:hypothetical protein [Arcicella aquatica]MEA5259462.1 hypothetical protein [Arcicella aquatica]